MRGGAAWGMLTGTVLFAGNTVWSIIWAH